MKIAVASDDKTTVRKGHFGKARFYLVFEVDGNRIVAEELRENPIGADEETHGRASQVLKMLPDCDVLIGRSMGRHSVPKLLENGKTPLLCLLEDAQACVDAYLNGERQHFLVWDEEKQKFVKP